jgi:purine-binding chemotaxis protein CheW
MKSDTTAYLKDNAKRQFCTFQIHDRLFGVDILDVKEVNPETNFTPIFHAPQEVRGNVNIRGQIYLVLDLRLILGFETKPADEKSRVLLFKSEVGEPFGILVDRIGDVVTVDENQIENRRQTDHGPSDQADRRTLDLSDGICKLEDTLLIIMNSQNLLTIIARLGGQR